VITQFLISRLLSNLTCVDHHWRKTPIVLRGYELKTVTKNRKIHIKWFILVKTQVLIARLLSNFTCVLIIIEGRPLLFFLGWWGGYEVKVKIAVQSHLCMPFLSIHFPISLWPPQILLPSRRGPCWPVSVLVYLANPQVFLLIEDKIML